MVEIPTLETPRLRLRPYRLDDFEPYAVMWQDPRVVRFIGGVPFTREQSWTRFLRQIGLWHHLGFGFFALEHKDTGAFAGESVNGAAVAAILEKFGGKVQLGGGIRTMESIERWLDLGVARVVIGTAALENPDLVRQAARDNPGRIVVAVDARDGLVATRGWADVSDVRVEELAKRFEDVGVASLLFTDVGRDGLLKGCNVEATVALARAVAIPVIASGGVTDITDIQQLAGHVLDGVEGVITGRALYDGRLDLTDALDTARLRASPADFA